RFRSRSASPDKVRDPQAVEHLLRGGGLVAGDVIRPAEVVADGGVGLRRRVDAQALVDGAVEVEDADLLVHGLGAVLVGGAVGDAALDAAAAEYNAPGARIVV